MIWNWKQVFLWGLRLVYTRVYGQTTQTHANLGSLGDTTIVLFAGCSIKTSISHRYLGCCRLSFHPMKTHMSMQPLKFVSVKKIEIFLLIFNFVSFKKFDKPSTKCRNAIFFLLGVKQTQFRIKRRHAISSTCHFVKCHFIKPFYKHSVLSSWGQSHMTILLALFSKLDCFNSMQQILCTFTKWSSLQRILMAI